MSGEYKVLLNDASTVGASSHLPFTEGRGTIIAQGTFAHHSNTVDVECSFDGTNFVPIQGLTGINEPIAIPFQLAHKVFIRARLTYIQEGHTPSITVAVC